jgi:predicted P-loop ATPase
MQFKLFSIMNSSVASPHGDGKESFAIGDYLGLLTKSEKDKFKWICPVCEGHNLSIAKDGVKYSCFDGCTGKQVAYRLRELNGEFKGKKSDNSIDLLQTKKPATARNKDKPKNASQGSNEPLKLNDNVKALNFIREVWGDGLKFNLRTLSVELNSKHLDADLVHNLLAEEYNVNITKQRALDAVYYLARKQDHDPFLNYLESCKNRSTNVRKNKIALELFKIDDRYYDELIWLFMLGVVKRAYEPGCKFDYAFVLQGEQGVGKSTFFRTLSKGSFSDTMTEKLDTDDLRKLHEHAINEWSELDGFTAKTYHGKIKAFLSRQEDQFRLPYAKDQVKMPRRSVIVGTVNESQFLTDMTGNRRFLVVPVKWIMPSEDLKLNVDEIWAAVIKDYEQDWKGEFRELSLSPEVKTRQKEENENYLSSDVLEEAIADWLEDRTLYFLMGDLAGYLQDWKEGVLGLKAIDRGTQMRIGKILNRQGWKKKQKWINGENVKAWFPGEQK